MWKYDDSWQNLTSTLNTTENYVSVTNITSFSIFAPLGSTTKVASCANLTNADTTYHLTTNLTGTQDGEDYCINIKASNITLIGDSYTITGDNTSNTEAILISSDSANITNTEASNYTGAIYTVGYDNISISNSNFHDLTYGIAMEEASSGSITPMSTPGSGGEGTVDNVLISSNTFNSVDYPIAAIGATNLTIASDTINGDMLLYTSSADFKLNSTTFNNIILSAAGQDLQIKSTSPVTPPADYASIGKFLNITNTTSDANLNLTIYYKDQDWQNANIENESSISMWHYNGTNWTNITTSHVDTANNIVYSGNVTSFSIFAPLGKEKPTCAVADDGTKCDFNLNDPQYGYLDENGSDYCVGGLCHPICDPQYGADHNSNCTQAMGGSFNQDPGWFYCCSDDNQYHVCVKDESTCSGAVYCGLIGQECCQGGTLCSSGTCVCKSSNGVMTNECVNPSTTPFGQNYFRNWNSTNPFVSGAFNEYIYNRDISCCAGTFENVTVY